MRNGAKVPEPRCEVLLVTLPFGMLESPSLALGILEARLHAAGLTSRTRHFTLDYAARIGTAEYRRIAGGFPTTTDLLGEWIFGHAVTARSPGRSRDYLQRVFGGHLSRPHGPDGVDPAEFVRALSADAGTFCDEVAAAILEARARLVGFTSVFQQNNATIAVARRLRTLDPSIRVVIGGANCEAPMGRELARRFSCFDIVVSGEADRLIAPLAMALLADRDVLTDPDVVRHVRIPDSDPVFLQARMVESLEDQPLPQFDDFVEAFERMLPAPGRPRLHIPMETSRGCWWGARKHCTFCGLNGNTMTFRSLPPDMVIEGLCTYGRSYRGAKISFVDNIMDHRYFESVLGKLRNYNIDLDLFYEVKSNITKDRLRIAHAAGLRHIQPGIESLSDAVLKLMKKGVRAIQNIQLLKWCGELGIKVDWNILWGFPGEQPADYAQMAALIPLICHLPPPARGSAIRLDRFSPLFQQAMMERPSAIKPYAAYWDVYEEVETSGIANLAYFFQDDATDSGTLADYTRSLAANIDCWRSRHGSGSLVHIAQSDRIAVFDSRPMSKATLQVMLTGPESAIYSLCDTARSLAGLQQALPDLSEAAITVALDRFCAQGIMWTDGRLYLALSLCLDSLLRSHGR